MQARMSQFGEMCGDKKLSSECQLVEDCSVLPIDTQNLGANHNVAEEKLEPTNGPANVRISSPFSSNNFVEAIETKDEIDNSSSNYSSDHTNIVEVNSVKSENMLGSMHEALNDVCGVGNVNINLGCDSASHGDTEIPNCENESVCLSSDSELIIPVNLEGEQYFAFLNKSLVSNEQEKEISQDLACLSLSKDIKTGEMKAPARKTAKGGTVKSEKKFNLPDNYGKYDPAELLTEMMNILSGRMKTDMIEYLVKHERVIPFIDVRKPDQANSITESEFKDLVKDVNIDDHKRVKKILDKLKLSDTDIFKAIKEIEEEETPKMSEMNSREFSYEASEANHASEYVDISKGIPDKFVKPREEDLTNVARVHFSQDTIRTDIVRIPMLIQSPGIVCSSMVCTDTGANISLEGLDRYLKRGGRKKDIIPEKIMLVNASEKSDQRILGYVNMKFYSIQDGCLVHVLQEKVFIIDGPLSELLLGTPAIKRMGLVIKEATRVSFNGKVVDALPDAAFKKGRKVSLYGHSNVWPDRKMRATDVTRTRGESGPAKLRVKYQTLLLGPDYQNVRTNEDLEFYESGFETKQGKEITKDNLKIADLFITVQLSCLNKKMSPSNKSAFNFTNLNSEGKSQKIEKASYFSSYGTLTRGPYDPKRQSSTYGHEEVHDDIITTGPVAISADERLKLKEKVGEDDIIKHLDPDLQKAIKELHKTYVEAFATDTKVVGNFTAKTFDIHTINNEGPQIKQFPLSKEKLHILKTEVEKLEKHGVFERLEKRTKYNSPMFPVGKAEGKDSIADRADNMRRKFSKYRVVFDARSLNSMTKGGGNCSLPSLDHVLSSIESKNVIIADLKNAYWALRYSESTKEKLAVLVDNVAFTHSRALMGGKESMLFLMEALGITFNEDDFEEFKKLPENECLKNTLLHECFIAYVDDLLMFHENQEALLRVYAFVLQQCCKYGWLVEQSKLSIMTDSFTLLGSSFERLPDGKLGYFIKKDKSSNMMKFPVPNTKRSLASRLSTISYYDRYLPGHKVITAVLFAFLKSEDNTFTHLLHRVWAMLMLLIRLDLCLAVPEKDKPIVILLDSSLTSCSSYLCQLHRGADGKLHLKLIKATSKVFGNSMMRASSIHKEMYNFVSALKSGEDILRSNNAGIVAITDCLPLVYTLRSQHTTNQFTVAGSWISSFPDMEYLHVNGSVLRSVDIHSRLFTNSFAMKRRFDKDMATSIPTDLFTTDKMYTLDILQGIADNLPSPEYTSISKIRPEPLNLNNLNHLIMEDTPAETEYFRGIVDGYHSINPGHSVWRPWVKNPKRSNITKAEFEGEMKKDMAVRLKKALTSAVIDLTQPTARAHFGVMQNDKVVMGIQCRSRQSFKVLEWEIIDQVCHVEIHGLPDFFLRNELSIDIVGGNGPSKVSVLPHNVVKFGHEFVGGFETLGFFIKHARPEKMELHLHIPVKNNVTSLEWDFHQQKTKSLAERILSPEDFLKISCQGFVDLFMEEIKKKPPPNPISIINDKIACFGRKSGMNDLKSQSPKESKNAQNAMVVFGYSNLMSEFKNPNNLKLFTSKAKQEPGDTSKFILQHSLDYHNTTQAENLMNSLDQELERQEKHCFLTPEQITDMLDDIEREDKAAEASQVPEIDLDEEVPEIQMMNEENQIEQSAESVEPSVHPDKSKLATSIGAEVVQELKDKVKKKADDIRNNSETLSEVEQEVKNLTQKATAILGGINGMIFTLSNLMSKRNVDFRKMFLDIQESDRDIRKLREDIENKKDYILCEGIVWRKFELSGKVYPSIVCPDWFVRMMAQCLHQNNFHLAGRRAYNMLSRSFYNRHMLKITQAAEKGCLSCHFGRYPVRKEYKGEQIVRPRLSGQHVSLDFLQSVPESSRGFQHILVATCKLSGFTILLPQKKLTGVETLSNILLLLSIFNSSKVWEMDGATAFNESKRYLTLLGKIVKTRGPSSKSQGTSERAILEVRTLLNTSITGLSSENRKEWDLILPQIQAALNATILYPKVNVYSRSELFFNVLNINAARNPFLLNDIFQSLVDIRNEKDARLIKDSNAQQFQTLRTGDLVFVRRKKLEIPPSQEDRRRFLEPSVKELYAIVRTSPGFVRLKSLVTNEERTVHRDKITPIDSNSFLSMLPLADTLENIHTINRYRRGSLDSVIYMDRKDPELESFLLESRKDIKKRISQIIETDSDNFKFDDLDSEEPLWDDILIETIPTVSQTSEEERTSDETQPNEEQILAPLLETEASIPDVLLPVDENVPAPVNIDEIPVDPEIVAREERILDKRREDDFQRMDVPEEAPRTRSQRKSILTQNRSSTGKPKLKVSYQDPDSTMTDLSKSKKANFNQAEVPKQLEFSQSKELYIPSPDPRIRDVGDTAGPIEVQRDQQDPGHHVKALESVCKSVVTNTKREEEQNLMKDISIKTHLQTKREHNLEQDKLKEALPPQDRLMAGLVFASREAERKARKRDRKKRAKEASKQANSVQSDLSVQG